MGATTKVLLKCDATGCHAEVETIAELTGKPEKAKLNIVVPEDWFAEKVPVGFASGRLELRCACSKHKMEVRGY